MGKFAPLAALMIYSVTSLDVAAHVNGGGQTSFEAAVPRVGHVGAGMWWLLTREPLVTLGQWGLPIFLWQMATNVLVEAFLVDVGWTVDGTRLRSRCAGGEQSFSFWFAGFYWLFHVLAAYVVAWLMKDDGLIGSLIHNAVKKITPA